MLRPNEIEIILDPKQVFGTSHHATTCILFEWLQDDISGGEAVLDVGAGSGIMAMVALRLGTVSAIGVECDSVAVESARDYASENCFGQELVYGTVRVWSGASGRTGYWLILIGRPCWRWRMIWLFMEHRAQACSV